MFGKPQILYEFYSTCDSNVILQTLFFQTAKNLSLSFSLTGSVWHVNPLKINLHEFSSGHVPCPEKPKMSRFLPPWINSWLPRDSCHFQSLLWESHSPCCVAEAKNNHLCVAEMIIGYITIIIFLKSAFLLYFICQCNVNFLFEDPERDNTIRFWISLPQIYFLVIIWGDFKINEDSMKKKKKAFFVTCQN